MNPLLNQKAKDQETVKELINPEGTNVFITDTLFYKKMQYDILAKKITYKMTFLGGS